MSDNKSVEIQELEMNMADTVRSMIHLHLEQVETNLTVMIMDALTSAIEKGVRLGIVEGQSMQGRK